MLHIHSDWDNRAAYGTGLSLWRVGVPAPPSLLGVYLELREIHLLNKERGGLQIIQTGGAFRDFHINHQT